MTNVMCCHKNMISRISGREKAWFSSLLLVLEWLCLLCHCIAHKMLMQMFCTIRHSWSANVITNGMCCRKNTISRISGTEKALFYSLLLVNLLDLNNVGCSLHITMKRACSAQRKDFRLIIRPRSCINTVNKVNFLVSSCSIHQNY